MEAPVRNQYLATEIKTATPQKLHLILIDAAIRAVQRGRHHWREGQDERACEALVRAQGIVGEIMAGFDRNVAPDLVEKMSALYFFIFRSILQANRHRDERKLEEALRILEIERGTWQAVCEKEAPTAGVEAGRDTALDPPQRGVPGPGPHRRPEAPLADPGLDSLPSGGFSVEA